MDKCVAINKAWNYLVKTYWYLVDTGIQLIITCKLMQSDNRLDRPAQKQTTRREIKSRTVVMAKATFVQEKATKKPEPMRELV